MTVPGLPSVVPDGDDWIAKKFAALEAQIASLRTDRGADYTTVGVDGTFKVDGTLEVTGDAMIGGDTTLDGALTLVGGATLTAAGDVQSSNYDPGNAGWKLDGTTGDIEINDATIRGGIIGDAALTNPVAFAIVNSGASTGLTFTTSFATYVTETVTVPAGFTRALVLVQPNAVVPASTAGGLTVILVQAVVDGNTGPQFETIGDDGAYSCAPFAIQLTGLSGSFNVSTQVKAIGGNTNGIAAITGIVIFHR